MKTQDEAEADPGISKPGAQFRSGSLWGQGGCFELPCKHNQCFCSGSRELNTYCKQYVSDFDYIGTKQTLVKGDSALFK